MVLCYHGKLKIQISGRLSTVPVSFNFFNSLLTPCFVQIFSGNSSVNLFAVYHFKYKLFIKILSSSLNTMLVVDKHCSDVCCDKFLVPQIDKKEITERTVTWKMLLAISLGERLAILKTKNIKTRAICLHFLPYLLNICRKLEFLISQESVATCLMSGGQCCMGFVVNFIRFPAMQKFWKSVKIWQSYREFKGGNFFETQCSMA